MLIRSTSNLQIKYIRTLCEKRKARKVHYEFFVEGVRAVSEAYSHGWNVKKLIFCPSLIRSDWAKKIVAESDPFIHLQVTENLHRKLCDRNDLELMAIVSQVEDNYERIPLRSNLLVIAVENPQNRGNLGTIIRAADAMGAHGMLIIEPAVDLYDPKTVRATMGSLFALPVIRIGNPRIFQSWQEHVRATLGALQVVGTSPHASTTIDKVNFTGPTLLVIGNEQSGISDRFEMMCDALISIPMSGSADSLNSAIAASIALYEAKRQRFAHKQDNHD
jgi:tRNA G18 (ribose-2'-O)-methylase SpoU